MTKFLEKFISIVFILIILVSFFFDLNNKTTYLWFIYEDLIYFIIFNFLIIFFCIKKKINLYKLYENNKTYLILIFFFLLSYFFSKEVENIKLVIYIFPLLFIDDLKNILKYKNNFNINKLLKFIFFFNLFLIFVELFLFKYKSLYLEDIVFNSNSYNNITKINVNSSKIQDVIFNHEIEGIGFRAKTLITNPISLYVNSLLLSIILSKNINNKYYYIFISLIVGLFAKSRLVILSLYLIINNFVFSKRLTIHQIYLSIAIVLIFIFFFNFYPIENFSYKAVFNSRLIFYFQFFEQLNLNTLLINFTNGNYLYYNHEGILTGPHSDILYFLGNYGVLITMIFFYKIFSNIKQLSILIAILALSLFNGLLFNSFFWVFVYLLNLNFYDNNYNSHKK